MRIGNRRRVCGRAHRGAVDGDDRVARANASVCRRLAGQRLVDDRRTEIGSQPKRSHEIRFPIAGVQCVERQAPRCRRAVCMRYFEADAAGSRSLEQAPTQILPRADCFAIERRNQVASRKTGFCRRRCRWRRRQQRTLSGDADHIDRREEQHGERQIRNRPCGDNRDPAPDVLSIERARQIGREHLGFAFVDHLDVTAQRNRRQRPLGTIGTEAARPHDAPEADRKAQHLDAHQTCDEVVA